ncbi:MAG: pyruvate kinase [Solirubrobacteraceae bacterium]
MTRENRGADPARRERTVRDHEQAALSDRLSAIREQLLEVAGGWRPWIEGRDADRDASARNLLQYLALRRHDLRELQDPLIALGLSSLGGSEGHVQASVDAVLDALGALARHPPVTRSNPPPMGFAHNREVLAIRTEALLGPVPRGRPTRIMVTMPTEAAHDPAMVRELLVAGMDCMRINCAHDAAPEWRAMLENLRQGQDETRRRARVEVDLPGPKLRTGPLAPQPTSDGKGDYLRLGIGDRLLLTRDAGVTMSGPDERPAARIGCSLAEAFTVTRRGHQVWLDDGKLGGVVESVDRDSIELRITSARAKGSKLRAGKGINLPDAVLDIDLIGPHSQDALEFAAECADIVGLSFVSRAREVERVNGYLAQHARPEVGMILKIETRRAFEHLPGLLLAALGGQRPAGVMIARGDLAVECGYERLAEVQEEILWLCQAAHVPVIWATQVLDRLAKTGRPSRAEITDAAMGVRAECVMLNKGPRIIEAISVLDDILRRMEQHHRKKRSLLPPLGASDYVHTDR